MNPVALETRLDMENVRTFQYTVFGTLIKYYGFIQICDYVCHDFFGGYRVLISNWYLSMLTSKKSFSQSLKFGPKGQFLYFKPLLVSIFVTITMVKNE